MKICIRLLSCMSLLGVTNAVKSTGRYLQNLRILGFLLTHVLGIDASDSWGPLHLSGRLTTTDPNQNAERILTTCATTWSMVVIFHVPRKPNYSPELEDVSKQSTIVITALSQHGLVLGMVRERSSREPQHFRRPYILG
ncbi:hypothetical protein BKA83DRAFT_4397587 [Pisolithus microcarpus]|nr:hypothetical protein BKA83DRAFT_4397587 [Pisolithus microcarpus]